MLPTHASQLPKCRIRKHAHKQIVAEIAILIHRRMDRYALYKYASNWKENEKPYVCM